MPDAFLDFLILSAGKVGFDVKYTAEEIIQYAKEENVKFVRLAFCDVYGRQKNVTIMGSELERAFRSGIAIDASAVPGFAGLEEGENQNPSADMEEPEP